MEQLVIDYLKQLLDGADFQYVPKTTAPAQNEELEQLKEDEVEKIRKALDDDE